MADTEPVDEEPTEGAPTTVAAPKGRRSFTSARRELSDDEMCSSGVAKMLLDELERLENECSSLKLISDKFHASDKKIGVLEEKLKQKQAFEIFTNGALAVGAALFGFAPFLWDKNQSIVSIAIAILGSAAMVAGFAAKERMK